MYPYSKRGGVAIQRAEYMIAKLAHGYWRYPVGVDEKTFNTSIEDHAHMPTRGLPYGQQYTYILNLWKEHNMTPLQAATNKRGTLIAERAENRTSIATFERAGAALAERNATITTEILALSATIGAEERKEREAKHRAMAEELRAAGYRVEVDTVSVFGATLDTKAIIAAMTTAYGAGPARQSRPTAPDKLGGVHGVGEGWYRPIVYGSNGVKLEHDFAINTRDHHEARNGWWLKHVPTGSITKGFPNEQEAHRWVRARTETHGKEFGKVSGVPEWHPYHYPDVK